MSAAAPSRRFTTTILRVLALAVVCFSGTAGAVAINAKDCETLLSWKPYAKISGVKSCSSTPDCGNLYGISCSGGGRVTKVSLVGNNLGGTLPSEWSTMTALTDLWLDGSKLSGTLPSEWSTMTAMYSLSLSINDLSGTLPSEWSTMTALTDLSLVGNNLSGTLPSEWSTMTALTDLVLSNNKLSGTLPSEWSTMTAMYSLSLVGNNLSGTLPSEWSTMTALTDLWLDGNKLSGTLPSEWSTMTALTDFNATRTKLCGPDPFPNIDTSLPACPAPRVSPMRPARASPKPRGLPSPPRPPTPVPPPTSKNGRCGVINGGRNRCPDKVCCSRWGWCGSSDVHCDATKGCQKAYGACPLASKLPAPGYIDTDPAVCGPNNRRRCRSGYCCSSSGRCSSLQADCSKAKGCQGGYGLCYDSQDDLQYAIDQYFANAGLPAPGYASTPTSNATRLSLYSWGLGSANACDGQPGKCKVHTVQSARDTLEQIAAKHGTTTWQILQDNPLLSVVDTPNAIVPLRRFDVLAVRPSPKPEDLRWQWTRKEALLLGSSTYPRPCSGYTSLAEKKDCFCHYHPGTGTYVWPFSTGANKCREAIECKYRFPILTPCPKGSVADDLEFNGDTRCLKAPNKFECSTGDGCTSVDCFCKEFLLKPGTYQNPFDSSHTTGVVCDWTQPGWYGGMVYCDTGYYFDPITRDCTTQSQSKLPYRRGYTSCDGVPDVSTASATSGRRLQAFPAPKHKPGRFAAACNTSGKCCKKLNTGRRLGCIPCAKGKCPAGRNIFTHVAGKNGCQCQVRGSCPQWFNRNCKFPKPVRK